MTSGPSRGLVKGILFDKDGTLFDFNATWGAWARGVLESEARGDPARLDAFARALGYDLSKNRFRRDSLVIAGTVEDIAQAVRPLSDGDTDAMIARFNAAATAAPQVAVTPLAPFLDGLRAAGLVLGVATNDAEAPARAHLRSAGIDAHFDFIAGYDSGFGGKPSPGQLHGFCTAMDLRPPECVMVGDSTHDLNAAQAAGMVRVAVLTGMATRNDLAPHADVVLDSIADLPDWLGL